MIDQLEYFNLFFLFPDAPAEISMQIFSATLSFYHMVNLWDI